MQLDGVRTLITTRSLGVLSLAILIGHFAELSQPTFGTDYFYDVRASQKPFFAFMMDGRYLSEMIWHLSWNMFPPTLLFAGGLALLAAAGLIIASMLGVEDKKPAVVSTCMILFFPLFFETFAYHPLRVVVPLGIVVALLAVQAERITITAIGILLTAMLYQSSIYVAMAAVALVAAVRLADGADRRTTAKYVAARATGVVIGIALYYIVTRTVPMLGGYEPARLAQFSQTVASWSDIGETFRKVGAGLSELAFADHHFFPWEVKWLLVALYLLACASIARKSLVSLLLLLATPVLAMGVIWISKTPGMMLSDRIQYPMAFVAAGGFLIAWRYAGRLRGAVLVIGLVVVAIFALQTNIRHQFMYLRNQADIDMSSNIADRLKRLPEYKPGLPLVIVGLTRPDYLPYKIFPYDRKVFGNTTLNSAFSMTWSANRILIFFMDFIPATPADQAVGEADSAGMPAWPTEGSTAIKNGRMIVVLSQ